MNRRNVSRTSFGPIMAASISIRCSFESDGPMASATSASGSRPRPLAAGSVKGRRTAIACLASSSSGLRLATVSTRARRSNSVVMDGSRDAPSSTIVTGRLEFTRSSVLVSPDSNWIKRRGGELFEATTTRSLETPVPLTAASKAKSASATRSGVGRRSNPASSRAETTVATPRLTAALLRV